MGNNTEPGVEGKTSRTTGNAGPGIACEEWRRYSSEKSLHRNSAVLFNAEMEEESVINLTGMHAPNTTLKEQSICRVLSGRVTVR
eukprot:scaffold128850_cov27-Prasinocladus_malaysianus.AAC.1